MLYLVLVLVCEVGFCVRFALTWWVLVWAGGLGLSWVSGFVDFGYGLGLFVLLWLRWLCCFWCLDLRCDFGFVVGSIAQGGFGCTLVVFWVVVRVAGWWFLDFVL